MGGVVAAGSRLVLQAPAGTFVLRVLDDTPLGERWSIPVIADLGVVAAGAADVAVPTDGGVLPVRAAVEAHGGALLLRPVGPQPPVPVQRRHDVRGELTLPLRAEPLAALGPHGGLPDVVPSPAADGYDVARSPRSAAFLDGVTMDVSAGGLSAQLATPARLRQGSGLYVEVDLPGGVAPTVVSVVEHRGRLLRARFTTISPRDREALARLVFARHRLALAERRRRLDGAAPA